jgi:hypothetical protein
MSADQESDNENMFESSELQESDSQSQDGSSTCSPRNRRPNLNVSDIGVDMINEIIAAQLVQDCEQQDPTLVRQGFISPSDTIQAPNTQERTPLWKYRLTLYRRRNASAHSTTMLELFKSFALNLLYKDKQASILPMATEHATFTHITSVKQVHAMEASRMKIYFAPWARNQAKSLSGELYIQSTFHPDTFREAHAMGEWLVAHEYDARPSISQTEEMRVIGCLLYSNHFIQRDNLKQAIIDDPSWNPENDDDFGMFHLTLRNFSVDDSDSIRIIFISAEVSKMEKMTKFFSDLYDGSPKRYPYCAPLLFVPLYKCNLSREFRMQLIRMHKDRVGDSVKAITMKGWHSLDTKVNLQTTDGSPASSPIKEILLGLPASSGMVTHLLFTNVEPQINSDFYLAVYAAENEELLEARLPSLTKDIYKLLAPGEAEKFFIDPSRGLSFGKDIQQIVPENALFQGNASPSSALQLQRITTMARAPSIKRTSTGSLSTPRSTRQKPTGNTTETNVTATYSGIVQTNRSFRTPSTSYSRSSTETTEVSIIYERRFVSIETQMHEQKQQQEQMNIKLDSLDEVAQESNSLIKQMMDDLKLTSSSSTRGSKRDKPSGEDQGDTDIMMASGKKTLP